jgi:amino acid transporter
VLKKIVIGSLAIIGAIYILLMMGLIWSSDCDHELKYLSSSPDEKYKAMYQHIVCKDKPSAHEITLISKDKGSGYVVFSAVSPDAQNIEISWISAKVLQIKYPFSLIPEQVVYDREYGEIYVKYEHFK